MKKNKEFIENLFDEIFEKLNNKDKIWLSIDLLSILSASNTKNSDEIEEVLNLIFNYLKINSKNLSTLLIPSFYFGFPQNKQFDTLLSKPELGSFPNYLFKKNYKYRSLHPFYSFYVFGRDKNNFITNTQALNDSVGKNSIFDYLHLKQYKLISLGHHYASALSSIHQCEYELGVNYRELLHFKGNLIDKYRNLNINGSFNFYGRKKEICAFSGITINGLRQLKSAKISKRFFYCSNNYLIGYDFLELNDFNAYTINNHNKNNMIFDCVDDLSNNKKEVITPRKSLIMYKEFIKKKSDSCL